MSNSNLMPSSLMSVVETVAGFVPVAGPFLQAALKIADATGLSDTITRHLGSGGEAVATAVVQAAASVAGLPAGSDPASVAAAMPGLDADRRAQLQVQLAQLAITRDAQAQAAEDRARAAQLDAIHAQIADIASARAQTVALAQAGSRVAWAPAVVSFVVLATFGVVMWGALNRTMPAGSETILNMLLGTLAAMATAVVSYWVGSSSDSVQKSDMLFRSTPHAAPPTAPH
jgi:hypothetical protein